MRNKSICLGLALCVLLSITAACKSPAGDTGSTPAIEPSPIATATFAIRSKTSGQVLEAETEYKPVGVMIENHSAARPQTGMQSADIVYEAPVEGCTRFMCIYNDTIPEVIAPVRSSRLYYIRFAQEWGCAYVHYGGANSGKSNIYTDEYLIQMKKKGMDIDFNGSKYTAYYWRTGNQGVHTVHTNVQELQTLIEEEPEGRTFLFDENAAHDGEVFSEVILPFKRGNDAVIYKYDSSSGLLVRYQADKEFIDSATGEAITVQNLIVQYNHYYHGNEVSGRWLCDITGTGKAEFFIGGVHFSGTWEKDSYESPTIYRDINGNEIVLRPGNTWIASHFDDQEITIN